MAFVLGILVLAVALYAIRRFTRADPRRFSRSLYLAGGMILILAGLLLTLSGRAPLGAFGVGAGILLLIRGSVALADDLHGRKAGGRENAERDPGARRGNAARKGAMTQEEAYKILGLDPGASAEEIRSAHRALMKKVHPDQGGTSDLASRVNQAKDVLLRTHR